MQLSVWKLQCRQSLITDSGHDVIANSLTLSAPVSGYCEAADVDVSLRDSTEDSIDLWIWFSRAALIRRMCYGAGKRGLLRWCTSLRISFDGALWVVRKEVIESSPGGKLVLGECFWCLAIIEACKAFYSVYVIGKTFHFLQAVRRLICTI